MTGISSTLLVVVSLLVCADDEPDHRPKRGDTLTNSLGMELAYVPPGQFWMGSPAGAKMARPDEIPPRCARLTRGFYMSRTEVTRGQFTTFVQDAAWETQAERAGWAYAWKKGSFQLVYGASFRNAGFPQDDDHPAVCVSWHDAKEFCLRLSHEEDRHYRLPTEAEWEYACRAGTETVYQWGDAPEDGAAWCNVADLSAKKEFAATVSPSVLFPWHDGYTFTAPVGQFRANAFGLHDMHGNVLEFCSDWYAEPYRTVVPLVDPKGPSSGVFRVLRGGDWSSYPIGCRAARRYRDKPNIRCSNLGFRVVLELEQAAH